MSAIAHSIFICVPSPSSSWRLSYPIPFSKEESAEEAEAQAAIEALAAAEEAEGGEPAIATDEWEAEVEVSCSSSSDRAFTSLHVGM